MAQPVRRASARRVAGRAAAGAAPDGRPTAGRGGDRQDAGDHAEGRDALVDPVDGGRGRADAVGGVSGSGGRSGCSRTARTAGSCRRIRSSSPRSVTSSGSTSIRPNVPSCCAWTRSPRSRPSIARRRSCRCCPAPRQRASHDYMRAGTSSLYAALDLASGKVIGSLHARHRAIEFKKFLQTIDREVPADLDVHVVLDNASTHKTPAIKTMAGWRTRGSSCTSPRPVELLAQPRRTLVRRTHHQETAARHPPLGPRNSTPTSAPGSRPGTTTRAPTSGPRPPTRSSNRSPATATELTNHDTSSSSAARASARRRS